METENRPRPAATVIITRPATGGIEVLLQRRAANLAFMGGIWVFPGGRVDDEDHTAAADGDDVSVARICAIREAREESGVDLLTCAPGSGRCELHPVSRWITPVIERRRYDTMFFIAVVGADTDAVEDGTEATETVWISPTDALARSASGTLPLAPPTLLTLHELTRVSDVGGIPGWAAGRSMAPIEPIATLTEAGPVIAFPGDPLFGPDVRVDQPTRCVLVEGRWVLSLP